jgi:exopolysaccharide biosynthesis polyprenyl glycosylphosphotransferase
VCVSAGRLESLLALPHPRWKRALDIVGSLALLAMAGPVLLLSMLLIRLTSSGPAIFCQQRAGHGGRPFTIYKLRTMVADAEKLKAALQVRNQQDGPAFKIRRDPRITRIGRFLRSTSIDELPQLWNVLKGDMSLVGPRPLLMQYLDRYTPEQARRNDVLPGITGWCQVNGRNELQWEEKFALDTWYVENWSFALDVKILFQTALSVIRRHGISSEGHVTMPEFMGSRPREQATSATAASIGSQPEPHLNEVR